MTPTDIHIKEDELRFKFILSSGPGGQNVNKVATGVQLRFNLLESTSFPPAVRDRLLLKLVARLTKRGELVLQSTRYRSQIQNKKAVTQRLYALLQEALKVQKKRISTNPSFIQKERRLSTKKKRSETKKSRRSVDTKEY